MNCDIDFCPTAPTSTLTVEITGSDALKLVFCKAHAEQVNAQLAKQLGTDTSSLDMYKTPIPYNVGDLQKAIEHIEEWQGRAVN